MVNFINTCTAYKEAEYKLDKVCNDIVHYLIDQIDNICNINIKSEFRFNNVIYDNNTRLSFDEYVIYLNTNNISIIILQMDDDWPDNYHNITIPIGNLNNDILWKQYIDEYIKSSLTIIKENCIHYLEYNNMYDIVNEIHQQLTEQCIYITGFKWSETCFTFIHNELYHIIIDVDDYEFAVDNLEIAIGGIEDVYIEKNDNGSNGGTIKIKLEQL